MSLSSLLQPNSYEIYARSLHADTINGQPFPTPIPPAPGVISIGVSKDSTQTILGPTGDYSIITGWKVNSPGDFTNLAFNSTTGKFTAPTFGRYNINGNVLIGNTGTINTSPSLAIFINNNNVKNTNFYDVTTGSTGPQISVINTNLFLNPADQLSLQINNPNSASFDIKDVSGATGAATFLSIHQIA